VARRRAEGAPEVQQRDEVAAPGEERHAVDRVEPFRRQREALDHRGERQEVALVAARQEQGAGDRDAERQAELEQRPFPCRREDLHLAAAPLDGLLHRAQADAAPGVEVRFGLGRQPRDEEERQRIPPRHQQMTATGGGGDHRVDLDTAAVVLDLDARFVGGGPRREPDRALARLARPGAFARRFDPMRDGVAGRRCL